MNEPDFEENELSDEDLAVLRAFDAMKDWPEQPSSVTSPLELSLHSSQQDAKQAPVEYSAEDMLLVFVAEVYEDIVSMRRVLNQLEREDQIKPERFITFRRLGHKLRGSAAAIECHPITGIAEHIEEIANRIMNGAVFPSIGVNALALTISALEAALQHVVSDGEERSAPLAELEKELENLLADGARVEIATVRPQVEELPTTEPGTIVDDISSTLCARVDARRLERLLLDSERLAELRTPLESAQAQVDAALQELHTARARLAQLESMLFNLLTSTRLSPVMDELSTSSLAARILSNVGQRNDVPRRRNRPRSRLAQSSEATIWDELDIERYTEQDLLLNSLREAIAAVNVASSRVSVAFEHLRLVTQDYSAQGTAVRNDTLLLRLVPLSMLVPRLREAITTANVQFEVTGESIEIDQQILEALSSPLIHLLQTSDDASGRTKDQEFVRIWLRAQAIGNEIAMEIGFSAPVSGGAVELLREVIQRLNGTLSLQRNNADGLSFHLRLARSQGTISCLLVRINDQHVIVPFSQVQRIGDGKQEQFDRLYSLHYLLGCPTKPVATGRVQPVLVLLQGASPVSVAVEVDEVVGEVELVVRPLASHLRRPGITNAAINGQGRVLLMADLPELIRHHIQVQHITGAERPTRIDTSSGRPKILLADDSVYVRQILVQMLKHENYVIMEARDGLEALEQLIQHTPDVFLLDVEMPNLNGYDLLDIMRLYPSLASVKIIMLTSRSSEKHMQHALDLGAHAYLTKPCTQEMLLATIQQMLRNSA